MASAPAEDTPLLERSTQEGIIQQHEEIASRPLRAVSAENVHRGDHIIYQVTEERYRACYESALVSCVNVRGDQILLLKNTQAGGVTRELVSFSGLKHPHVIQYSTGLYSNDDAIERAERRLRCGENHHHVLFNNSHHFVTLAKAGKENSLAEITKDLLYDGNSYPLEPLFTMVPTEFLVDVHPGDHLMVVGRVSPTHWLVESVSHSKSTYTAYTYRGGKVSKVEQAWKADKTFRIDYGGGADIQPPETVIKNANGEYMSHSKWLHSDEFVTMMKTGTKYSVDRECPLDEDTATSQTLFTKSRINSLKGIQPGYHIMITQRMQRAKHLLIVDTYLQGNTFVAFTTNENGKVERIDKEWNLKERSQPQIFRILYPGEIRSTLVTPEEAIENAEKEYHKWESSDEFVTMMKTGKCCSLAQQCLFSPDNNIISYTPVTPDTAVDEGDHIILQDASNMYHSVFLYKHVTDSVFAIMPSMSEPGSLYGEVDLAQYQAYRVNYKETLPPEEAQIRACSEKGEELLRENLHNPSIFISWAKAGKKISVSPGDVGIVATQESGLLAKPLQIVQLHPSCYEKISSTDDIQVGDHLIRSDPKHWFHCMVTKRDINPDDPTQFKINCQLCTAIEEKETSLDPRKELLYRIKYPETLAAVTAIETGPEEGIEVDLITNGAAKADKQIPMSPGGAATQERGLPRKPLQIAQLRPWCYEKISSTDDIQVGDHLIRSDPKHWFHCMVTKRDINPDDPTQFKINCQLCTAIEEKETSLDPRKELLYRIKYPETLPALTAIETGPEEGIEVDFITNGAAKADKQIPISPGGAATQERGLPRKPLQIAQLRPWCYEKISSTDDIQVGDHLIQRHLTYWFHCMVTKRDINPDDHTQFKIIYQLRTAVEEKETSLDPSKEKLYRIKYPETLPAETSIKNARSKLAKHKFSPKARVQFVQWAKTGSEEGIEVNLLTNKTLPVTKSRIWSFCQLNRGDYLVETAGRSKRTHHYLITEVCSPTACLALESWSPSGTVGRVIKTKVSFEKSHEFYRINYDYGTCFTDEVAIQQAESFKGHSTADNLWSDISRQKFVNFVKTGESEAIDESELHDDRLLLPRRRVESALELKPGDHIECLRGARQMFNHHMLVIDETVNKRRCKVIHFGISSGKKAELLEEEVDIFVNGCVFCIHYSERINPGEASKCLRKLIRDDPQLYNIHKNNREHVVMKATVGEPMSIQVHATMERALQFTNRSILKPVQTSITKVSLENIQSGDHIIVTSAKATFKLGYRAATSGTIVGAVGGIAVGVNILLEGPLLARGLYKLHQKKKFGVISDTDYNHGIIRQSFITVDTVLGGVGGSRPLRADSVEIVHRGDHIMYQVTEEPFRACYESALVSSVRDDQILLLKNTQAGGVTQEWVSFSDLRHPRIIQYSTGLFSNDEAIERAERRLRCGETRHHVLFNNSHHFVTLAKTGKENPLVEITKGLMYKGNSYPLDPVLTKSPTVSLVGVHPGDHLMVVGRVSPTHWLVESVSHSKSTYTAYTYRGGKVSKMEQAWKADKTFRIDYGGGADIQPPETVIKNSYGEYMSHST